MTNILFSKDKNMLNQKIINFMRYNGNELATRNIFKFAQIVFRHFLYLTEVKSADHSIESIYDRILSPQSTIIFAMNNGSIIGYLIAEPTLHNMENLMHIYYLYVIPAFRNKGVATYLLTLIEKYANDIGIEILSLTYDTYNDKLTKFYNKNNFRFDDGMRSYQRYDMLVKRT